jgi:hypothetical protein
VGRVKWFSSDLFFASSKVFGSLSVEFLPISNSEAKLSVEIEAYSRSLSLLFFLVEVTTGLNLVGLFDLRTPL